MAPRSGGLSSPGFLALLATQFFGAFNDNMLRWLAVPIAQSVVGTTAAVTWGCVFLTAPFLVFTPVAGWLADRYSKRTVIVVCKVAEIAIMLLAVGAILSEQVWALFAVIALMGTQSALFGPAKFGSLPDLLPAGLLAKGNGLMGLTSIAAVAMGTVAGFALYDFSFPTPGVETPQQMWLPALALVGVAVAGTLASLFLTRFSAADPERPPVLNPLTDLVPALKILVQDPPLLRTSLGIAFFFFLASLSQMNIDPFGELILGLSKTDVGLLLALLVVGVGLGSVLAGLWSPNRIELGIVPVGAFGIVVSAIAVFIAGSLFDPSLPPKEQFAYVGSCAALLLLGISAGLYDVPLEAYLQDRSPEATRGTILAGNYFISFSFILVSSGLFYLMHGVIGMSAAEIFMVAGIGTIPVALYATKVLPDVSIRFLLWLWSRMNYRMRVTGLENVPAEGGALIVANHVSFVDGILILSSLPRMCRFIIYADFAEMPFLRRLAPVMQVIPIRATDGPRSIVRALQEARRAVEAGELVCIFAEGQLTRTGQMQPFQRGLLRIVDRTNIPVIPTHLDGLWGSIFSYHKGRVFWKRPLKWPYPVAIRYGEPMIQPDDAAIVRQQVERLGAEAAIDDVKRRLIPARKFIRHCKRHGNQPKLADSSNVAVTGRRTLVGALAFARVLKRSVLADDERHVGVLLPPSVGGCLANAALALLGRVSVNLNYTLSDEMLNVCVRKGKIRHVLTSRRFLEKKPTELEGVEWVFLEDVKAQVSALDKVLSMAEAVAMPASLLERRLGLHRIDPDDPLTIIFTSGSTGEPKGVVLSHGNIGSNIDAIDMLLDLKEQDGILGVLPFFHSFGYTATMWLPICHRLRAVYHFNPLDARVVGRLCQEHKLTILMTTPTFMKMYLRRIEPEQLKSLDLVITGAEKLPMELARAFEEKFGILPTEGYGTTELSPVAAVNVPDHRSQVVQQGTKLGTVGRPIPGVAAKVIDPDTGEDLGIDQEGLLLITGPNVMQGYLDEPDKTAEVIREGWYSTGDFGKMDADGFVTITGRRSRFSKIGGEMVPHILIEEELTRLCEDENDEEGLLILAVTAVPDEFRGERLIVIHRDLPKPVDVILRELAQTGFPKLWLPSSDSFLRVDEIPVLGTGKLDLRRLKEVAMEHFSASPATQS